MPGFTGGSRERLVVPVPAEEDAENSRGIENPGYTSDEDSKAAVAGPEDTVDVSAFKQSRPRRKRHPAAISRAADETALLTNDRLALDSEESGEETESRNPRSERPDPGFQKAKMGEKAIPASAPASLRDVSSVVTTVDINIGRDRNDSILQLEDEEKSSQVDTGKEEIDPYYPV